MALDVVFISDCCCFLCFFFFKQKTAYDMRISDWSSDVCSSDLHRGDALVGVAGDVAARRGGGPDQRQDLRAALAQDLQRALNCGVHAGEEIGRASGRERVCKYV